MEKRIVALASACFIAAMGHSWWQARADVLDPAAPTTIVLGPPSGYAAVDRLDARRSGLSPTKLPSNPKELWRVELTSGLRTAPVVGQDGGIYAALLAPEVVHVDAKGGQLWRTGLSGKSAVTPPVLSSDGTLHVVSEDGSLWALEPDGRVRFRVPLGIRTHEAHTTPLPLADGNVVVAGQNTLVVVDRDGTLVRRASFGPGALVGGILQRDDALVVTAASGVVFEWRAPMPPRQRGSFSSTLSSGATLVGTRTLVAVVGRSRLEALDLETGARRPLIGDGGAPLIYEGPPAISADGIVHVSTMPGELIAVGPDGAQRRTVLDDASLMLSPDAGAPIAAVIGHRDRASPPVIIDGDGRVGFVRSTGRVGIAHNGGLRIASSRFCARPLSVLPAGPGRMLVACGSGSLGMFGD